MNKKLLSITALIAAVVAFVALNLVFQKTLRSARADLTEGSLYTLSKGSRNIAASLKEPIQLTLYYSEQSANDATMVKPYAARVKELLREYATASGGKVNFKVVNPEPFSDAEDQAVQAGLAGAPTGRGSDRLYFGLIGKNSTDRQEVIPFFDPQKEDFLEYDITHLIYLLSDAPKKTIGLMSWLPLEGQQNNPMMGGRGGQPPWQIYRQISELFDVKKVNTNAAEIPQDIGVLMIVHPKKMSSRTQFAIDQFVLRGGRLLVFIDPLCEADVPPGLNPMQAMNIPKTSEIDKLLANWGMEMLAAKIACDRDSALAVQSGSQSKPERITYVAWLSLSTARHDANDPITGQLQSVNVATAGILNVKEGATTQITPLFKTSTDSQAVDASQFALMPDPKKLLSEFSSGNKELILGARITGKVKTAFPDGLPPLDAGQTEADAPKPPTTTPLKESADPINVVVMADCDMLSDHFWISPEERLGPIVLPGRPFADNGQFVIAALDNLSGSSDLMSLRARAKSSRPFETVQKIQKDAEQKYLAKQQELENKLQDTERKIADLQRSKADASGKGGQSSSLVLSAEQRQAIERFRHEAVDVRRQLRDVQHQLRKDIERLGGRIKAINLGLMPLLVGVAALALAAYRSARRKTERHSTGSTS